MNQQTIGSTIEFRGVGLHTGRAVKARMKPAAENTGVVFVRTDLPDAPRIPARPESVAEIPRRTALAKGEAQVQTVEHVLSALAGLGVDNVEIELDGPEVPGMDGSALAFCALIRQAGIRVQDVKRREIRIPSSVSVIFEKQSLVAVPAEGGLTISYTLTADSEFLPPRQFTYRVDSATYESEIAPARTWVLEEDIAKLKDAGLGKGANPENTVIVGPGGADAKALRFPDEFVRHKILDTIGDLSVLGGVLHAHVIAASSGHRANGMLARKIRDLAAQIPPQPQVERSEEGLLDVMDIQRVLPHRYPFLLVDRVIEIEGNQRAVGVKNVTITEPWFQGHFPGQPVMPGVLQIEAMAQLAGVLALRSSEQKNLLAYLLGISDAKFRKTVVPGDQMVLEVEVIRVRSRTGEFRCKASVQGKLVSECSLRFMLVDAREGA